MENLSPHEFDWDGRLLEWLDGCTEPTESKAIGQHVAGCSQCQRVVRQFKRLDQQLTRALPPLALDEAFDRRILAQLQIIDEAQRKAMRRRVAAEMQKELEGMKRRWRRTLMAAMPGMFAGGATGVMLLEQLDSDGLVMDVFHHASQFGGAFSNPLQIVLTALLGAAIGCAVTAWLASSMASSMD